MSSSNDHSDGENSDGFVVTVRPMPFDNEPSPLSDEKLTEVRQWLEPTAYDISGGEYRKHASSHLSGTGSWLTASAEYQQWLTSREHGLLWIKGIPGSGKSVMAAKIIAELREVEPKSPVLYFFFRQIIDANHEPSALLRDWMDQLLGHSPVLQKQLHSYVQDGRTLESVSLDDMWKVLKLAFSSLPGKVFCITDALDEMDNGNDSFLKALAQLGQWQPEKVKVLITSRPVPSVENPLHLIACLKIRLREVEVDQDISRFVQYSLQNSHIEKRHWPDVINAVPGKANGLFLYARLAMDAVLEPGANIETALAHLPTDLNVLYTNLLIEHISRSGVDARHQRIILQAVTHATRPLRLLEIAEMLGVVDESRDLKARKELVKVACGPLLEILADETVSVIHHSFTEYLKGVNRPKDSQGYAILGVGDAHEQLASICLQYLQSGSLNNFPTSILDDEIYRNISETKIAFWQEYPFLKYAASNWHKHVMAACSASSDDTKLCTKIRQFLENSYLRRVWCRLEWKGWPWDVSKVHVAAALGLTGYLKELLRSGEAVESPGYRSPLSWAAGEGHAGAVQALIAAGAELNLEDTHDGHTALHKAATENHYLAARLLLKAGVSPLIRKGLDTSSRYLSHVLPDYGESPLRIACEKGHLETLNVMLEYVTDLHKVHWALAWAAYCGQSKLVARILEYPGVDVNARVHGDTFLYWACSSLDFETIEMLLQAGADVKMLSIGDSGPLSVDIDYTPLPTAPAMQNCLRGMFGNYQLTAINHDAVMLSNMKRLLNSLLAAGLDVNQRDRAGQAILHQVTEFPVLVHLLISAGADATAADQNIKTALHFVKNPETIPILVRDGGADINAKDADGKTPLHCVKRNASVILKLIELGADCDAQDDDGNSPLHLQVGIVYSNMFEGVVALLQHGANPNVKNQHGKTPLRCLNNILHSKEIADSLLQAGADVDAKDSDGKTVLFDAVGQEMYITQARVDTVQYLIVAGASKKTRDNQGRSIAHEVIKGVAGGDIGGVVEWLDVLDSFDVFDLEAVDNAGNNLLHELCFRVNNNLRNQALDMHLIKLLSDAGLDMSGKNQAGHTPLHLLCTVTCPSGGSRLASEIPLIYAIRDADDINVPDANGNTPLHIASVFEDSWCKWLLDAGADPTLRNHDGMTPLHLAARCKQSNTIGMLLNAIYDRLSDQPSERAAVLNARVLKSSYNVYEPDNITPLFYACQSGRPESVKLLLDAGADPNIGSLFVACATMEQENRLWMMKQDTPGSTMAALRPLDTTRPPRPAPSHQSDFFHPFASTRLEEILDMLVLAGINLTPLHGDQRMTQQDPLWKAASLDSTYAHKCLTAVRDTQPKIRKLESQITEYRDPLKGLVEFDEWMLNTSRQGFESGKPSIDWLRPEGVDFEIFRAILIRREYHLVKQIIDSGCRFLVPWIRNLEYLIVHGFTLLFDQIAEAETRARFSEGEWHAFGDPTKPGLHFEPKPKQETQSLDTKPQSQAYGEEARNKMLQYAVGRALPNMEIVQLLVGKYAVNINGVDENKNTVLHIIARGKHWWQCALALPYLLESGADIESRNWSGQTPLHLALDKEWGVLDGLGAFHKDVAETLIKAGADVNAADSKGRSCLDLAGYSIVLIDLLINNGAIVNSSSIFSALQAANGPALKRLLQRGADANGRLPFVEEHLWKEDFADESRLGDSRTTFDGKRVPRHEITPIFFVASRSAFPDDPDLRICFKALVDHGADIYATIQVQNGRQYEPAYASAYNKLLGISEVDESIPENRSVLHELVRLRGLNACLIEAVEIKSGSRDPRGCNLLHAVCDSWGGPDAVLDMELDEDDKDAVKEEKEMTAFQRLIALGCDVRERDNIGQSVMHHMIYRAYKFPQRLERVQKSIEEISRLAPELLDAPNASGNTPMHYSALLATSSRGSDKSDQEDSLVGLSRLLLLNGASPAGVNRDGNSVLHFLAPNLDHADVATLFSELVRDHGLDIKARNALGETPLMLFASRSKILRRLAGSRGGLYLENETVDEAVAMLETIDADFSVVDKQGNGLLHLAAADEVELFKAIMDKGKLDPMMENQAQLTAIDVAAAHNNNEILALFEKV
ncbi:hypothetical protein PWT90_03329 [Aphanocladium album]|nr:hypothetical protein PWT90_03329 [Aphanocladium album]